MAKNKTQKIKPVKAWAGVSDGKLHCWGGETRYYEIYPTRSLVKTAYEQYVRVMITPNKPASRKG